MKIEYPIGKYNWTDIQGLWIMVEKGGFALSSTLHLTIRVFNKSLNTDMNTKILTQVTSPIYPANLGKQKPPQGWQIYLIERLLKHTLHPKM